MSIASLIRRIPATLAAGSLLAVLGAASASAHMPGASIFKPTQGMIYTLGSKRAIGYFLSSAGKCQVTLMIAEAVDPDVAQPTSAARMSLGLAPGQSVSFASAEGEGMVLTCGTGADTVAVERTVAARS